MFKICTYDALAIGETFTKNVVFVEKISTREEMYLKSNWNVHNLS